MSLSGMVKNEISIQRNPVKDKMQLRIFSTANNRGDIDIYDEMGKRVG